MKLRIWIAIGLYISLLIGCSDNSQKATRQGTTRGTVETRLGECKDGFEKDKHGNCVEQEERDCPAGKIANSDNECVDICNEKSAPEDLCLDECRSDEVRDANGDCYFNSRAQSCEPGYDLVQGYCIEECPQNQSRDGRGFCVASLQLTTCAEGEELNSQNYCVAECEPGQVRDGSGYCINEDYVPHCGLEEELGYQDKCVKKCLVTQVRNSNDECVDIEKAPRCEVHQELDGNNECQLKCLPGEERNEQGKCVKPCAYDEEHNDEGECIKICKEGETRNSEGACETPKSRCTVHQIYDEEQNKCLTPEGFLCEKNSDCANGNCAKLQCSEGLSRDICLSATGRKDYVVCDSNEQCASGSCQALAEPSECKKKICRPKKETGQMCLENSDCEEGSCVGGLNCLDTSAKFCMLAKGRPNGSPCCESAACESGWCSALTNQCRPKIEINQQGCTSNDQCTTGHCEKSSNCPLGNTCLHEGNGKDGSICCKNSNCKSNFCDPLAKKCSGWLENNKPCIDSKHCKSGYCNLKNEEYPNVCLDKIKNGGKCHADEECQSGECFEKNCMFDAKNGDPCALDGDCRSGRCDDKVCKDKVETGEACKRNIDCKEYGEAFSTVYCRGTGDNRKCKKIHDQQEDEHCSVSNQCAAGLYCNSLSKCKKEKTKKGAECRSNKACGIDEETQLQMYCNLTATDKIKKNTCTTEVPNGRFCKKNSACQSGRCEKYLGEKWRNCKSKKEEGQKCNEHSDCKENRCLYLSCRTASFCISRANDKDRANGMPACKHSKCKSGRADTPNPSDPEKQCMARKDLGESCNEHEDCKSELRCGYTTNKCEKRREWNDQCWPTRGAQCGDGNSCRYFGCARQGHKHFCSNKGKIKKGGRCCVNSGCEDGLKCMQEKDKDGHRCYDPDETASEGGGSNRQRGVGESCSPSQRCKSGLRCGVFNGLRRCHSSAPRAADEYCIRNSQCSSNKCRRGGGAKQCQ